VRVVVKIYHGGGKRCRRQRSRFTPTNVGPNSGAPATVTDFWAAFRTLGM